MLQKTRSYFTFVKFEHTIFAMPFAISSMLLAFEDEILWDKVLWIVLCMVAARSSAMSFNRIIDRHIDSRNPRTSNRDLVTGKIKLSEAILFYLLMSALFVYFAYRLNILCFYLSPIALVVISLYPFLKRFTYLCHLVLGLSLAMAPAGAWIAVRANLELPAILLSAAVLFWVTSFDIIYSLLDIEFDRKNRLFSAPAVFGDRAALNLVKLLHVLMIIFIFLFGYYYGVSFYFYVFIIVVMLLLVLENVLSAKKDHKSINTAFFNINAFISFVLLAAATVEFIL